MGQTIFVRILPDASVSRGIFPRPKQVSTGHLFTLPASRPAFQIPPSIKRTPIRMDGCSFWRRRRDLFAFSPMAKIYVSLGQALASNSPPDCCIFDFQIPPMFSNKNTHHPNGWCVYLWRRRRDLNPRYPFGVYTISNRARSASYATSPCAFQPAYHTSRGGICQYLFCGFSRKIPLFSVDKRRLNRYNSRAKC